MTQNTAPAMTPLNLPRPLAVTADDAGTPRAVTLDGRPVTVVEVLDTWRIDDEWWREEVSRRYYHVQLADGRLLTIFADLIGGGWYAQRYGARTIPVAPDVRAASDPARVA